MSHADPLQSVADSRPLVHLISQDGRGRQSLPALTPRHHRLVLRVGQTTRHRVWASGSGLRLLSSDISLLHRVLRLCDGSVKRDLEVGLHAKHKDRGDLTRPEQACTSLPFFGYCRPRPRCIPSQYSVLSTAADKGNSVQNSRCRSLTWRSMS